MASAIFSPQLKYGRRKSTFLSFVISDEELSVSVYSDVEQDCTHPATPNASRSPVSPSMMSQIIVNNGSLMRELVSREKLRMKRRKNVSSNRPGNGSGMSKHMSPILEVRE
ncbi:hypothetical protein DL98DRAFT_575958 [Cadophora sp. DSE1049]|nr:hypothetical protein DL98DRAFT_575958 [Cadophora sp. DSE1049]